MHGMVGKLQERRSHGTREPAVHLLGDGRRLQLHADRHHGHVYSSVPPHVCLNELGKRGAVIKRITLIIGTGKKELVKVPCAKSTHSVKVAIVS